MIIIVGTNIDDVLYFVAKVKNKKSILIFKKYRVITGTILNREVCLIADLHSDYMTAAVVSYLIEKYHAIMVFNLGVCRSFTKDFKKGDIAISRQVFLGNVNMIGVEKVVLGQIPDMPASFVSDPYVTGIIRSGAQRIAGNNFKMANFVSVNNYKKERKALENIMVDDRLFGQREHIIIDSETGGSAVAAQLYDIPFMAIKIVEGEVDEVLKDEHLFDAYKKYPLVGKIITYCIGEIGRNDMLQGN